MPQWEHDPDEFVPQEDEPQGLWDESQLDKEYLRRRRGLARLEFPMDPKKALRLITGQNTYAKAQKSFAAYLRAHRRHWYAETHRPLAPAALEEYVADALSRYSTTRWSSKDFKATAVQFVLTARPGFTGSNQRQFERMVKIFSRLGLSLTTGKTGNLLYTTGGDAIL